MRCGGAGGELRPFGCLIIGRDVRYPWQVGRLVRPAVVSSRTTQSSEAAARYKAVDKGDELMFLDGDNGPGNLGFINRG